MTRYRSWDQVPDGMRKLLKEQGQGCSSRAAEAAQAGRGRRKYGNVRTEFNGETFDSKAEAQDEQLFAIKQAAGEIGGYAHNITIPLRGATRKRGSRAKFDWLVNERRPHTCSHCGHVDRVMGLVIKDTKGFITPAWETKRRLAEAQLGVKIEVIQH